MMNWLRQLRWKLFVSHSLIIAIAVVVLLPVGLFLISNPLLAQSADPSLPETGVAGSATTPRAPSQQELFQAVVDQALLISAFAALAAAVVVSLFVSRRIVEPLQELTLVSRRLAQGYFRERTTLRSDDELADLSRSINQLAEALEKTEQRRLGLLTDVAHELRTPLTTIEGYMEGLIDGIITPEPQLYALIHHEATRLKWMIEEMALLSRAEAGQLRVELKPIDLPEIIRNVAAQFQPQCLSQDLTLGLEIAPELPKALADPDRVEQILINLLANAVQYTASGGQIGVQVQPHDFLLHVSVSDSGCGIASEHLPHIFERFYRVDKSRSRQRGGAGIGLTIARHLVYAHGGEIWAESDGPGQGSTFHFTVPINEPSV